MQIELLPWTTWSNPGYSWGYNPVQDFAVESNYVAKLDAPAEKLSLLKALIADCHRRGIHVILDGVYNHVGAPSLNRDMRASLSAAASAPFNLADLRPDYSPHVNKSHV